MREYAKKVSEKNLTSPKYGFIYYSLIIIGAVIAGFFLKTVILSTLAVFLK